MINCDKIMHQIGIKANQVRKNQVNFQGYWTSPLAVERLDVDSGKWTNVGTIDAHGPFNQPISFEKSNKGAYSIRFTDANCNESAVFQVDSSNGKTWTNEVQPLNSGNSNIPIDTSAPPPSPLQMDGYTAKANQLANSPNAPVFNEKTGQYELIPRPDLGGKPYNPDLIGYPNAYQTQQPEGLPMLPPYEEVFPPHIALARAINTINVVIASLFPASKQLPTIDEKGKPFKPDGTLVS